MTHRAAGAQLFGLGIYAAFAGLAPVSMSVRSNLGDVLNKFLLSFIFVRCSACRDKLQLSEVRLLDADIRTISGHNGGIASRKCRAESGDYGQTGSRYAIRLSN